MKDIAIRRNLNKPIERRATGATGRHTMNYQVLKAKHAEELNDFPIFFAFSNKQFEEGMEKAGLTVTDTDKIYSLTGGGFIKKTDSEAFHAMFKRNNTEISEAILSDKTGEGFILEMFDYELSNHEYCITGSTEDTLDALGLSEEDVDKSAALKAGLRAAIGLQYDSEV